MILSQPALGHDVQLGMLYDFRSSQFFAGVSLWDNDVVNAKQTLDEEKVQNANFEFSCSLEEARRNSSLDVEGSLSLDLNLLSATGSARYLNYKKSSTHEAHVNVSCTIVRRTRRIPQEILASVKYDRYLDEPLYTHFVAEVVEGGSATLSFTQSCSSAEEAKEITGELQLSIVKIPVTGGASLEFSEKDESRFENVKISYSGAMAENVSNLEDARRIAREMPTKLAKQLNTLHYKLLPLTILDSKANRLIRSLNGSLINKTAIALKAGTTAGLKLRDLVEQEVFQKQFPAVKRQISNFQAAFSAAETEFTEDARRLLPELRDGTKDEKEKTTQLQAAVVLFQQRTSLAERFIEYKYTEADVLRKTVAELLISNFENHLGGITPRSLFDGGAPRLLLSFGGPSIGRTNHPLQGRIESRSSGTDADAAGDRINDAEDDNDSDDEDEEWFEDQKTTANIKKSFADLCKQRLLTAPGVTVAFGVASINKAYRPGGGKKTKTSIGDIILDYQSKHVIITGMLPKAPRAPELTVEGRTITVAWLQEREESEQLAVPTTGFIIKYCRRLSPLKAGRESENEIVTEVNCAASATSVVLDSLSGGCDYEVALSIQTIVGVSAWSIPVVARLLPSSAASEMIDLFNRNRDSLSKSEDKPGSKPWDLYTPSSGNIAVRIVDVAVEFKPEIKAASVGDTDNTVVFVFVGPSSHGKSTEINAFISYLLGGEVDDPARILVVDDRGAQQFPSVTQIVTCFRIRPLSPLFEGKTLLIVDTPGYGDSRGVERDAFVTVAMSEFFKMIGHVNAIIFTCRANEMRTTLLSPVSTYVFSLFAKDVRSCLRTIYTFSDAGAPQARSALTKHGWPVKNGEISVNNSAFTIDLNGGENDVGVRESWLQSAKGQFQLMQMLLRAHPVPIKRSAFVTQNRILLEQKCELTEKKVRRAANATQNLIAGLIAVANSVGAGLVGKIEVIEDRAVQKPLPDGTSTTLCLDCNFTCHEICSCGDDYDDKIRCIVMANGRCTICKGRCQWNRHKKPKYIITTEKHSVWVRPYDLIKFWNEHNNRLENGSLDEMNTHLQLLEGLRNDILDLAKLSEELISTALFHDPSSIINYIGTLIQSARVRGAPPEQLIQLAIAKNTLILVREVKGKGDGATRDSEILIDIISGVRKEMVRRMKLSPNERVKEEEKSCTLYNDLHEKLPVDIRSKAPKPLGKESTSSRGALYPENLQAIVELIQVVLKDVGVMAALAGASSA